MNGGKVDIMRRRFSENLARREEEAPELFYSTHCTIGSLYGKELYEALNIKLENTVVFEVRSCRKIREVWKEAKEFVVLYDGDLYDIYAVDFKKTDKRFVQLKTNRIK